MRGKGTENNTPRLHNRGMIAAEGFTNGLRRQASKPVAQVYSRLAALIELQRLVVATQPLDCGVKVLGDDSHDGHHPDLRCDGQERDARLEVGWIGWSPLCAGPLFRSPFDVSLVPSGSSKCRRTAAETLCQANASPARTTTLFIAPLPRLQNVRAGSLRISKMRHHTFPRTSKNSTDSRSDSQ